MPSLIPANYAAPGMPWLRSLNPRKDPALVWRTPTAPADVDEQGKASVAERLSLLELIFPASLSNRGSQAGWGWGRIFKYQLLDL